MKNIIKKIALTIIYILLLTSFILGLIFIPKVYKLYKFSKEYINKPFSKEELQKNESRVLKIYDRNNILLANIFPEYGGFYKEVKYSDLPQNLIEAVISAEDKNFFKHKGIDYKAILRAFISNLLNRKIVSGGSTITQQLSKSIIHRERNYINKFYEALDSIRLEKNMTKEEILTEYLNRIFFGNNCYGIGAAAELYFKKEVKDLNINESVILASIIKSGTKFNPYKYKERLHLRKIYVLGQMKNNNYIKEEEYNNYINENITIYTNREKNILKAPHFVMYIKDSIGKLKYSNITEVKTTLDYKMQKEASLVISNASQSLHSFNVRNISCVILNAKTGEVLSMIGSMDYFDKETDGSVNGAIALRQPGSALKPFLYAYLFDKGESPASVIGDIKTYINSPGGDYIPENFDRKYRGPVTIRDALANSLNIPAVRWLSKYSLKDFQNILLKSGLISIDKNPDYYGYSLVLGSAEVRLIDLASAYTIFPNSGIFINHYSAVSLKKENGDIFYFPKKSYTHKRVISEESAYLINKILSDRNARMGSFRSYRGLVYPFSIAIKTGTSKGSRDAWAIGYTKDYIVGLWLGDFKGSEMINITGGNGAVPILYDLFSMLNKSQKETKWHKPKDIIEREICLISGKLRGEFCKETRLEEFSIFNVPKEECDVHNLYIKRNSDGSIDKKVFLNLSSEYNDWIKERQIEKPNSEWIKAENTYAYNNLNQINNFNSINNQNKINERISITSPTDNSVYKIDSTLPLEYQNIFISSYIPKNIIEANLYCNEEIIANIEELKNGSVIWNLKKGDYTFYIKAINFEGNELKSPNINIFIQ
ncbi:penicillin-binding protein 1C [Brachyspira aalborgi]|uniref:peptidoglycan glycosyltransferase n=1 Tax=Brachyspira aalborgi TaxID=29522 RepID=A0ABY3KAQ9_9SPIR|nr:penicillin-binding protein 1C [Brachyspira aalborgi]TXJ33388.1 penicillin-binding protein 1C [Brachyspira aalborgi]TXJ43787.1 penicillin-binding protein 1C [Brachyspira aalborgi]CCY76737.1 penicillin-binding protein 2 [Brachyspira sp. CAG:700]